MIPHWCFRFITTTVTNERDIFFGLICDTGTLSAGCNLEKRRARIYVALSRVCITLAFNGEYHRRKYELSSILRARARTRERRSRVLHIAHWYRYVDSAEGCVSFPRYRGKLSSMLRKWKRTWRTDFVSREENVLTDTIHGICTTWKIMILLLLHCCMQESAKNGYRCFLFSVFSALTLLAKAPRLVVSVPWIVRSCREIQFTFSIAAGENGVSLSLSLSAWRIRHDEYETVAS